ncbi:uncharacterized protein LOC113793041 [Dermatophagoides pteronyssinus]|uniref:uncharacterized protein LOC113793041 n=1 Tax=Dermatophagoides pteronyssinus TaxID=6956 RepID=UPI003F6681EB
MECDLITMLDCTSNYYYGIHFGKKSSYSSLVMGFLVWVDYINFWIMFIQAWYAGPGDECLFMELSCQFLGEEYRIQGNILLVFFRSMLFLLYHYWIFDDQNWLIIANKLYNELNKIDVNLTMDWARKRVQVSFRFIILLIISYNLNNFATRNRTWIDRIFNHLFVTLHTYFLSYFLIQNYLINEICVNLFRQYNQKFCDSIKQGDLNSDLLKHFPNLYLMIQYVKIYVKQSYIILVSCLFGMLFEMYHLTFYSNMNLVLKCINVSILAVWVSVIVIFSVIFGRPDEEASILSNMIYEDVNVKRIPYFPRRKINSSDEIKKHPEYSRYYDFMDCLNHTVGLEIMDTPINAATVLQFITAFFSVTALFYQKKK